MAGIIDYTTMDEAIARTPVKSAVHGPTGQMYNGADIESIIVKKEYDGSYSIQLEVIPPQIKGLTRTELKKKLKELGTDPQSWE